MGVHASCCGQQREQDAHEQTAPEGHHDPSIENTELHGGLRSGDDDTLGHAHRGVSVAHLTGPLMEQVRKLQREEQLMMAKPTVADIEPLIIRAKGADLRCPRDGKLGAAYVDTISDGGKARFMLSYTWGYPIEDIAETLAQMCTDLDLDPAKTFVWMCCFCVNQHRVKEDMSAGHRVPFETFRQAFADKVRHLDMVAMMSPWHDPYYLKRVWCIFEMYTACNLGREIIVAMPHGAREAFQSQLLRDGGTDGLWSALKNVNIERAEASVAHDRDNIFELIKSGPGFAKLNQVVARCLKNWAVGVAENFALERIELRDLADVELGKLCCHVTDFMKKCGRQRYTMPLREAGKQAFERAGTSESAEGWQMQFLDSQLNILSHDMKGLEPFLEKAGQFVSFWDEQDNAESPNLSDAMEVFCNFKAQDVDENIKLLVRLWLYLMKALKDLVEHGNTISTKATFEKWKLVIEQMGTPTNTLTAVTSMTSLYFNEFFCPELRDTKALAQISQLFDFIDDRDEKEELWSPDHAAMLTLAARIKGIHGQAEAAMADAEAAYAIYEKLGGIEFRHEGKTGCDTCGELMLYMGVLKYQKGSCDSALKDFQCWISISEELGVLERNMFCLSFCAPTEKDALARLHAASNR